jgi:hypothetical protein
MDPGMFDDLPYILGVFLALVFLVGMGLGAILCAVFGG